MTQAHASLDSLSDAHLLTIVRALAADERRVTGRLIAALAVVDSRRLYLGAGFSSLFAYCTRALQLSEHAAYGRIEAARAARRCPAVLELLESGTITLTTVTLLAPHLVSGESRKLLERAAHKSRREVEQMVASLNPQPDVAATVRRLPSPRAATHLDAGTPTLLLTNETPAAADLPAGPPALAALPPKPAVLRPLAPERFKIQFTVSREVHDKFRRAQDLLRHTIPDGDPAAIFDKALTLLLDRIAAQKWAATAHPRRERARRNSRGSRNIPAAVRRAVWTRDQGQCGFIGTAGRCAERSGLEFHHVTPFAAGGEASVTNIELRCRRHNAYESELWFGRDSAAVSEDVEGGRAD